MFGCIVAGRPVQTNMIQVDQSHYVFSLADAQNINHITVFLSQPFPPGYGATIHYNIPPSSAFTVLGVLTNDKPSGVFKLRGFLSSSSRDDMVDDSSDVSIQLGISIEPLEQVLSTQKNLASTSAMASMRDLPLVPSTGNTPRSSTVVNKDSLAYTAECVAKNFFNFASGFQQADFIPTKVLNDWYSRVMEKLSNDPSGAFLFKSQE
ncbi:MAG: hypothetical protein SGCHY_001595 [Lobulomycetales sp.]